jgi:hypothetical protein
MEIAEVVDTDDPPYDFRKVPLEGVFCQLDIIRTDAHHGVLIEPRVQHEPSLGWRLFWFNAMRSCLISHAK